MSDKDGGPAFPQHAGTGNMEDWRHGMSLRDYFAAQALAGFAANSATPFLKATSEVAKNTQMSEPMILAIMAYDVADAMLTVKER